RRDGIVGMRKSDGSNDASRIGQLGDRRANACVDLRVDSCCEIFLGNTDADPSNVAVARGLVTADGCVDARRVEWIAAGNDLENARGSSDVASEGPDLIEARRESHEPISRYATVSRFDADRAREARGLPDGSSSVGA